MAFSIKSLNFFELTRSSHNLRKPEPCSLIYRNNIWTCICICKNANNLFSHGFSHRHKHLSETRFHLTVWMHVLNGPLKHLLKANAHTKLQRRYLRPEPEEQFSFSTHNTNVNERHIMQDSWCAVYACSAVMFYFFLFIKKQVFCQLLKIITLNCHQINRYNLLCQ